MSDSPTASNGNGNGKRRRLLLIIAAVFIVAGIAWLALWWLVFSLREVTDDAYVNGNQVILSSQVPGTVTEILADDTQRVNAGQVLVKLDPTDSDLALAKAQNALAQAVRQVRQQTQMAGQYDAAITAQRENLARAQADLKRREPLLAEHAVAPEEVAHARQAVVDAQEKPTKPDALRLDFTHYQLCKAGSPARSGR